MIVIVYFKKPFIRIKYKGVHSIINNSDSFGMGMEHNGIKPLFIRKSLVRKVVIKDGKKNND